MQRGRSGADAGHFASVADVGFEFSFEGLDLFAHAEEATVQDDRGDGVCFCLTDVRLGQPDSNVHGDSFLNAAANPSRSLSLSLP